MSTNNLTTTLSARGAIASEPPKGTTLWDVLANPWHPSTNPSGYVSLGVAENTLMHPELTAFVQRTTAIPPRAFTYGDGPLGSNRLRAAMVRFLNRRLNPVVPIEVEHIVPTNGVTTAIEHCAWALANPGDGILLGQPYYGAFPAD
ncbi:hypothetical protein LTS18_007990, partial [Coniosporium uncinatum]